MPSSCCHVRHFHPLRCRCHWKRAKARRRRCLRRCVGVIVDVQKDSEEEDKADNHVIHLKVQELYVIMQDKVNHNKHKKKSPSLFK